MAKYRSCLEWDDVTLLCTDVALLPIHTCTQWCYITCLYWPWDDAVSHYMPRLNIYETISVFVNLGLLSCELWCCWELIQSTNDRMRGHWLCQYWYNRMISLLEWRILSSYALIDLKILRKSIGNFEKILKNFRCCRKFWRHFKQFLRDFRLTWNFGKYFIENVTIFKKPWKILRKLKNF